MRAAFAIPAFRRLFVALAATMVADSVLLLTFGIWVKTITGSSGAAALTLVCVIAPELVAPALGWVVDQFPRRRFLLVAYPCAALTLVPLIFVRGPEQVWIIYVVAVAYGVALVCLPGAVGGLLKLIVPPDLLVHANASTSTFKEGLRLFGPLVGAGLFAAFGAPAVIIVVALAYAVAMIAIVRLRVVGDVVAPPELRWRSEFVAGMVHLFRDKQLWYPLLVIGGCTFTFGFLEPLVYTITDAYDKPATYVGVLVSVQGVGAVVGGLLSGRIVGRLGYVGSVLLALLCFTVSLTGLALAPNLIMMTIAWVPLGFGLPVGIVAFSTATQVRTPAALMGRVTTTVGAVMGTPQLVAIGIGAGIVAVVDYHVLLLAMAAAMFVLLIILATWSRRTAPDLAPPVS